MLVSYFTYTLCCESKLNKTECLAHRKKQELHSDLKHRSSKSKNVENLHQNVEHLQKSKSSLKSLLSIMCLLFNNL